VLLVLACPCSIVLAAPVAALSGIAAAAKHGVVIKGECV
jgi:Cd2+/Zn2+-exporting ATPase